MKTQDIQDAQEAQDVRETAERAGGPEGYRVREPEPAYVPPAPIPGPVPAYVAPPEPRRQNAGIVLPVLLIGLGLLFFLNTMGVMDWSSWDNIWRLWPLVLVAFGLEILVGRRSVWGSLLIAGLLVAAVVFVLVLWAWQPQSGRELTSETISQPTQGATRASVTISFGAGRLWLGELASSEDLVAGTVMRGNNETVTQDFYVSDGTAFYTLRSRGRWALPFFGSDEGRRAWDLDLNPKVPTDLSIDTGVGEATLDFEKLTLTGLHLNMGVGDSTLTMPAHGDLSATLNGGVGNVTLNIPEGMAASIRVNSGLGQVDVAGDYARNGDVYESPGYEGATDRLDLKIDGGVGNVRIRQVEPEREPLP
jgi:hypothetical protein